MNRRQAYNGGRVTGLSLRLDVNDVVVVTVFSTLPAVFGFLLLVLARAVDANVLPRGQHLFNQSQPASSLTAQERDLYNHHPLRLFKGIKCK